MNKITYLDGTRLHRALVAGVNNVLSRQDYLNKINVFPVPDGDTGTNMAFTLTSIMDRTAQKVHPRMDDMLALVADAGQGCLMSRMLERYRRVHRTRLAGRKRPTAE